MSHKIPETAITVLACALAILHMVEPDRLRMDSTTLVLLIVAAVPWLFPFLKSLTLPGGTVVEFREKLREVEKKVDVIEDSGRLPGRPEPEKRDSHRSIAADAAIENQWNTDPNRARFGGSPRANDRVLEAKIEPAAGADSAACRVSLSVRSIDAARPLTGKVTFYLHPTFGSSKEHDVSVVNGVARYEITSWGVFTVGAVADEGKTRLELNLADVEGGTAKFYRQ
jgi:hypothetical protein